MSVLNMLKKEMSLKEIMAEEDGEVRRNKLHWFSKKKFIAGVVISIITILLTIIIKTSAYRLITTNLPFFQVLIIIYAVVSAICLILSFIFKTIKPEREKAFYRFSSIFDLYHFFMKCICVLTIIMIYAFSFIRVKGKSMEPTYKENQIVFTRTIAYNPKVGDPVIIFAGNVTNEEELFVKRIIALPGDTVSYNSENKTVYVNDEAVQTDSYWHYYSKTITLKEDEYFLMGDNRVGMNSLDSRSFGPITRDDILAKVLFKMF